MFREEDVSEVGDVVARTYHFCSDDCLERWKRSATSENRELRVVGVAETA
jgi:hypothetical protein